MPEKNGVRWALLLGALLAWPVWSAPAEPALPAQGEPALCAPSDLIIPVQGVLPADLSDTYTDSRGGGQRAHEALDIMAPRGTPVLAVANGRIAKLFLSKPGGITIYQIDASGKVGYYYAHLDGYAANLVQGQEVRQGQLLGYVGTTGNANPNAPHLHFGIFCLDAEQRWWTGTPLNPYPYLRGAQPGQPLE